MSGELRRVGELLFVTRVLPLVGLGSSRGWSVARKLKNEKTPQQRVTAPNKRTVWFPQVVRIMVE